MGRIINVYSLEVGVLLKENNPAYKDYAIVFDKKRAYFDESHLEHFDLATLQEDADSYVKNGVENTYAIITKIPIDFNNELLEEISKEIEENGFIDNSVDFFDGENYNKDNVVYSIYKENGTIKPLEIL